ncbi:OLC1v1020756C1 [Oldenlandia corymbosa var. corymbosa]|uniref:OLC1v1020756C1 n=1 Tax=Oldenlandia corymbosa var. corymbosa TaxID=529605 RepID=A0AAV1BXS8_OLDCO|nr:OLC1v1020756C1 [Oldenlandia corymbosa var. corymbosa]
MESCRVGLKVVLIYVFAVLCNGEDRHTYLVLMEGDPVAFHQQGKPHPNSEASKAMHAKHLINSHDEFLQKALDVGSYTKLYSFKHIVNGFAVHTTPTQVDRIKNASGVKLVEKDRRVKQMTTYTPEFLGLPSVWTQEGGDRNAGEGVVIGVIDSGINPIHPSFAPDHDPTDPYTSKPPHFSGICQGGPLFPETSCNGKIVSARFFSAGAEATGKLNSSADFHSPYDAVGHGSHVASIAAGNHGVPVVVDGFYYGRASGMAPRARIAVYKAIYPSIGALSDVLAAIDQAVLDGVDIITLSIGPDEPPADTVTFLGMYDIFMLAANKAGKFVVQAVGNTGPGPYTVVSYSPWAFGVAASETDRNYPGTLILGNGQKISGVGLSGPSFGQGLLQHKLVLAKDAVRADGDFPKTSEYLEECQHPEALVPEVVLGSVVICTFSDGFYNGTSTLTAVIQTAKSLGFMGFVLVSNPKYGDFIAEAIPFLVSGIMIPRTKDAQVISRYYDQQTIRDKSGCVIRYDGRASIGEGRTASYAGRAPIISRFSARGPDYKDRNRTAVDVLKPDILAPGHQIWGAWNPMSVSDPILAGQNFALQSGTSMATPHIAGIAAILKQNHTTWTPSMIASAMSTTATKYDNQGDIIMARGYEIDSLYTAAPFGFGSGHVDPSRAIDPGLVFPAGYGDYVSFLCSLPNVDPSSIHAVTGGSCTPSFGSPADLNVPSVTITALTGSRTIRRRMMNVGSKAETYVCAGLPPRGVAIDIHPQSFRVAAAGGIQVLDIKLTVTEAINDFSFGELVFTGSLNHIVRLPISVFPVSLS